MPNSSSQFILDTSREYGIYVLDTRAIPAMTDGLKSSQRIALWLMRNKSDKVKTIALAGQMIASELYLHGDAAAANAISMLAGPFCNNRPLLDGDGAFGTRASPTSFAAPRYTYVKRSKIGENVLYADLDIVPMTENYDGSALMPATFLPLLPLVLLNGIKGIAPGWSTNILPRRYDDLVRAVTEVLETGKVQTKLTPCYENLNVTVEDRGDNQYAVQGSATKKNTTTVVVSEIPPELTLESFRERLGKMEEDGKIVSFTDRSTKTINIEIKMTRAALSGMSDADLIEFLSLRTITTEIITVQGVGGKSIVSYESAEKLVEDWVKWRLGLYLDRYQRLLDEEYLTNLYWRYVLACFKKDLPGAVGRLSSRAELKDWISKAGKSCKLPVATDDILDRISALASYKWTGEGYTEAQAQLDASAKRVVDYEAMVKSDRRRKTQFKKEVGALT